MNNKTFRKIIIIVAAFITIVIIASIFGIVLNSKKSASLEILVAPSSAKIKIGGQIYQNGNHNFIPGTYEIELSKDGFKTYTDKIILREGEETKLYHYLEQTDGGFEWYLNHKSDMMLLNSIGDYKANIEADEYAEKDPIFKVTPYYDEINNHFQIVAEENEGKIKVTANLNTCTDELKPTYIKEVHEYLESQGINPADYDITYESLCDN